jgi:hypothetical protein
MVCFDRKQFEIFKKIIPHNTLLLMRIPEPDKIYEYVHFLYFANETDGRYLTYGVLTSYIDLRYRILTDFDRDEYLRKEREKLLESLKE